MPTDNPRSYIDIDEKTNEEVVITAADDRKDAKIIGLAGIGLIAVVFLMFGWAFYQNAQTVRVSGIVTDVGSETITSRTSSGTRGYTETHITYYSHTFSYTHRDGGERIASTGKPDRDSHYEVGDEVAIGYYPDDASQVRIMSWFGLWKVQLTLAGLGLFLLWYRRFTLKGIADDQTAG